MQVGKLLLLKGQLVDILGCEPHMVSAAAATFIF